MFIICSPALRETYAFLNDPECQKLGMHAWMTVTVITTEFLICIKLSTGEFKAPTPQEVILFWIGLVSCVVTYGIWLYVRPPLKDGNAIKVKYN